MQYQGSKRLSHFWSLKHSQLCPSCYRNKLRIRAERDCTHDPFEVKMSQNNLLEEIDYESEPINIDRNQNLLIRRQNELRNIASRFKRKRLLIVAKFYTSYFLRSSINILLLTADKSLSSFVNTRFPEL